MHSTQTKLSEHEIAEAWAKIIVKKNERRNVRSKELIAGDGGNFSVQQTGLIM